MAKYCTTCGKALQENDRFCIGCGTPVPGRGSEDNSRLPVVDNGPSEQCSSAAASALTREESMMIDSESDMAATEVWQIPVEKSPSHADPFIVEVPKAEADAMKEAAYQKAESVQQHADPVLRGSSGDEADVLESPIAIADPPDPKASAEDDEYDESPTIVAQFLGGEEDDEDESPTIVVARERYVLVRDEDAQRTEVVPPCILGRGKAADQRVKGNLAVSRKHAKVFKEDGKLLIQDLGSTNGTFVDGEELEGDQCVPIEDGSKIRLGTEDFTFHVELR